MWAGVVAWGDRWGGIGNRERVEAVLAGAELAAPPGDAGRRRTGRGVGGAGGAPKVPVVSAHGGRLHVDRVVDEDLRGPLGHRRRRVGQRVTGWRRRRAGQGAIHGGTVVDRWSRLVPGQRRGQPGRDGWGAVGHGQFGFRHCVFPSWRQRRRLEQLLPELVEAAARHGLEL